MSKNIGPTYVEVGGRSLLLNPPDPVILSGMFEMLVTMGQEADSIIEHVMDQLPRLKDYPKLAEVAMKHAIDVDNANRRNARFEMLAVPKGELVKPKACAKMLHLLAITHQPDLTYEQCLELVQADGSVKVLTKLGMAFPDDDEKKSPASSDSSSDGADSTGPEHSPSYAAIHRAAGLPVN